VIEANGGRLVGLMPNRLLTGRRKLVFHIMLDKD
jgi:hypothetical protein